MSINTPIPFSRTGVFADLRNSFSLHMPKSRSSAATLIFFLVIAVTITFLQKFSIFIDLAPIGVALTVGSIEVPLPIFYLAFVVLAFFAPLKLDLWRLALFSLFTLTVIVSTALQSSSYSVNSVLLLFAIYMPFIFYLDVKEETYRRMISIFLNMMLVVGLITVLQHVSQIIWSYRVWPDLDKIVPQNFLMQDFVYIQPLKYASRLMKPNAVFFLEVSALSQWLAIALALELVFFARVWRMAFYASVLLSCFAGTGLLLLVIAGPVLLGRLSVRTMSVVFLVALIAMVVAIKIHWYDTVNSRFTEYSKTGASANFRFVAPIQVMLSELDKPGFFFSGEGAGSISKTEGNVWWVVAKIAYEYGIVPMLSFSAYLLYVLFKGAPSKRMAFTYAVLMNFMGGFIIPAWPLLIFLLGGMFRIKESRRTSGRGRDGRSKKRRAPEDYLQGAGSASFESAATNFTEAHP